MCENMSLTLDVPDEIAFAATDLAPRAGLSTEELLLHTLRCELIEISPSLQEELRLWEQASEEDVATVKEFNRILA